MYDFYYNKMTKGLKCDVDLGMSDTDSFLFKVGDGEIFHQHIRSFMDYSNYPKSHPLSCEKNKARLGFFKDELAGKDKCIRICWAAIEMLCNEI